MASKAHYRRWLINRSRVVLRPVRRSRRDRMSETSNIAAASSARKRALLRPAGIPLTTPDVAGFARCSAGSRAIRDSHSVARNERARARRAAVSSRGADCYAISRLATRMRGIPSVASRMRENDSSRCDKNLELERVSRLH